jgi:hypothetical protein
VTGRHRGGPDDVVALKAAVWLLGFGAFVVVPLLGILAYAIYAAVGKPPAYLLPLTIALASALGFWLCGDLVNTVLRKVPRTPPDLRVPLVASQVSLIALVAAPLSVILGLGQNWDKGSARFVSFGAVCVFAAVRVASRRILDPREDDIPE